MRVFDTEYHVTMTWIIRNSSSWRGLTLDLLTMGGFVQMPDGRFYGEGVHGLGTQIETGRQYLMFLSYREACQAFTIVKLWELRNGVAIATDNADKARARSGVSKIDGMPAYALFNRVRGLVPPE